MLRVGRASFDQLEHRLLSTNEVRMGEFDIVSFVLQRTMFNIGDLPKAVHIQLPYERREVIMLEVSGQDLARESRLVVDVKRRSRDVPGDKVVAGGVVDQRPELGQEGGDRVLSGLHGRMIVFAVTAVAEIRRDLTRVHIYKRKRSVNEFD